MRYSPTTGLFYSPSIHKQMPADCLNISPEEFQRLLIGRSEGRDIIVGPEQKLDLVQPPHEQATLEQLCAAIDRAADSSRRAVAGDQLRSVEYAQTEEEAAAFAAAGYPADDVPRTVAAWAVNGRTVQEAADDILAEAAAYREAIYRIRELRLQGKEQVRALYAQGEISQAEAVAIRSIADLQALQLEVSQ